MPHPLDIEELPTPEVIRARNELNRRKYGEFYLIKATDICEKIRMATLEADMFFPGNDLFRKGPLKRKAELGVILDYVSRQLSLLNCYLLHIRGAQFPVDTDVNLFHHILDRLIIMTAILTKDYSRVHSARRHYRKSDTVPPPALFSLLTNDLSHPNDPFNVNEYLENYVAAGLKVARALFSLHKKWPE